MLVPWKTNDCPFDCMQHCVLHAVSQIAQLLPRKATSRESSNAEGCTVTPPRPPADRAKPIRRQPREAMAPAAGPAMATSSRLCLHGKSTSGSRSNSLQFQFVSPVCDFPLTVLHYLAWKIESYRRCHCRASTSYGFCSWASSCYIHYALAVHDRHSQLAACVYSFQAILCLSGTHMQHAG